MEGRKDARLQTDREGWQGGGCRTARWRKPDHTIGRVQSRKLTFRWPLHGGRWMEDGSSMGTSVGSAMALLPTLLVGDFFPCM